MTMAMGMKNNALSMLSIFFLLARHIMTAPSCYHEGFFGERLKAQLKIILKTFLAHQKIDL